MPSYQGRALLRDVRGPRRSGRLVRIARVLAVLAVAAALAHVPWNDLRRRFVVVTGIEVRGAHYLDPAAVAVAAGVSAGDDLIALDPRRVRQALKLHSRIAEAKVSRVLRTVRIDVVEREPLLLVPHGAPWEIDSTGVLLEPLQTGVVADVPLLVGPDLARWPAGTQLRDPDVERGLAWMRALGHHQLQLTGRISEIDVRDDGRTSLTLLTGTRVIATAWPPGMRRMSALRAVIADLESKNARPDEVDVRFERQIIVRPALSAAPDPSPDHS